MPLTPRSHHTSRTGSVHPGLGGSFVAAADPLSVIGAQADIPVEGVWGEYGDRDGEVVKNRHKGWY